MKIDNRPGQGKARPATADVAVVITSWIGGVYRRFADQRVETTVLENIPARIATAIPAQAATDYWTLRINMQGLIPPVSLKTAAPALA